MNLKQLKNTVEKYTILNKKHDEYREQFSEAKRNLSYIDSEEKLKRITQMLKESVNNILETVGEYELPLYTEANKYLTLKYEKDKDLTVMFDFAECRTIIDFDLRDEEYTISMADEKRNDNIRYCIDKILNDYENNLTDLIEVITESIEFENKSLEENNEKDKNKLNAYLNISKKIEQDDTYRKYLIQDYKSYLCNDFSGKLNDILKMSSKDICELSDRELNERLNERINPLSVFDINRAMKEESETKISKNKNSFERDI